MNKTIQIMMKLVETISDKYINDKLKDVTKAQRKTYRNSYGREEGGDWKECRFFLLFFFLLTIMELLILGIQDVYLSCFFKHIVIVGVFFLIAKCWPVWFDIFRLSQPFLYSHRIFIFLYSIHFQLIKIWHSVIILF